MILVFLLAAAALSAQTFQSLATNEDGSALYLSSQARPAGTDASFHSKIYRWDAGAGFTIPAEQRDRGEFDGCNYANFFQLAAPSVSADGGTLAWTAYRPVGGGRFCPRAEPAQGVVRQGAREVRIDGVLAISRGGRFAVSAPAAAVESRYHFVTDLSSGAVTVATGAFSGSSQTVTDDGAVIVPEAMALVVVERSGVTRLLRTAHRVDEAIVDRAGGTAVYVTRLSPSSPGRITSVDIATGRETATYSGFGPSRPVLTSDASSILFLERSQAWIASIGGANLRQLTDEPDGIASAVISGNGRTVYAATGTSRLLRIDAASGAVTQLSGPAPSIAAFYRTFQEARGRIATGSVVEVAGSGLRDIQSVNLCGRDIPAAAEFTARLRFRAPWDLPEGRCVLSVRGASFEHGVEVEVRQFDPVFSPVVVHENFQGIVSTGSPARAGEAIVAYMSGLGPVDEAGRLLRSGFTCRVDFTEASVEYAGLAPNYEGVYQVNIRVPRGGSLSSTLSCGWDTDTQAIVALPAEP